MRLTLINPSGAKVAEIVSQRFGQLPLSSIQEIPGSYLLEVASLEDAGFISNYEVRIESLRKATEHDGAQLLADKAHAEAERLRAEWKAESLRDSIKSYERMLSYSRASEDLRGQATALRNIGDIYSILSESDEALKYYKDALQVSQNAEDRQGEIDALNQIGRECIELGKTAETFKLCEQAQVLSLKINYRRGEALALNYIGLAHYMTSDLTKALEIFNQALSPWREVGDKQGEADALLGIGYTLYDTGSAPQALECYNQAVELYRTVKDSRGEALALTAIGGVYSYKGEKQRALELHTKSVELLRAIGDRRGEAASLNGMGYAYEDLGEKLKALDFYNRALYLFHAIGSRSYEALTMGYIGRIYQSLGDNEKSLAFYNRKLAASRELGDRRMQAYTLKGIGVVYDSIGDKQRALDYFNQAFPLSEAAGDRRGQAYILNNLGDIYNALGNRQKAIENYNKALPLIESVEDRRGHIMTLYNLARLKRDMDDLGGARSEIETSISIIESLRSKLNSQQQRTSYFASVHQNYKLYIDILMRMHKKDPSKRLNVVAFGVSEMARARSMLETLAEAQASISNGTDSALLSREQSLQQLIAEKAERQIRLLNGKHSEAQATGIAKEIREITNELERVRTEIKLSSPRYATLVYPIPLSLSQIQQHVLDGGTVLLEYALCDERSYLWVVTQDSFVSYELPGREQIEKAAANVSTLITARQPVKGETIDQYYKRVLEADRQYWPQATVLAQMLLGQVVLPQAIHRLLIVAEGALQYVSYSALPRVSARPELASGSSATASEPTPLILDYEIVCLPSASTLSVLRNELEGRRLGSKAVAVFADPVFDGSDVRVKQTRDNSMAGARRPPDDELKRAIRDVQTAGELKILRLPSTRREAEAIASAADKGDVMQALDFEANLDLVQGRRLSDYRILHFATHGFLNNEHPELSGIVLSLVDEQGQPRRGFLRLEDIYNLNLSAELVVLSACRTALGKDVKGEGLVGLTRGFMYAGAASVIASLWAVDDLVTASLMKLLYMKMLQGGLRPAAALRAAQLQVWKQKQWRAPYYWAPFVLQGEWK